jgi:predicted nucleic acid-binding protein
LKQRILVDLNVLLDVLAERQPHYRSSAQIWSLAERGIVIGMVAADSFTTLHYLLRKISNDKVARQGLSAVLAVFEIIDLDGQLIRRAIESDVRDFEDAVQIESAARGMVDYIVTRDLKHFGKSHLPVRTPEEFLLTAKF